MEIIKIDEKDVNYCIGKLCNYHDPYSMGILSVFQSYILHKDFKRMRDELEAVPPTKETFHLMWDVNLRMEFLEVIYPI